MNLTYCIICLINEYNILEKILYNEVGVMYQEWMKKVNINITSEDIKKYEEYKKINKTEISSK